MRQNTQRADCAPSTCGLCDEHSTYSTGGQATPPPCCLQPGPWQVLSEGCTHWEASNRQVPKAAARRSSRMPVRDFWALPGEHQAFSRERLHVPTRMDTCGPHTPVSVQEPGWGSCTASAQLRWGCGRGRGHAHSPASQDTAAWTLSRALQTRRFHTNRWAEGPSLK